ncbi:MAG: hypothetical protein ACI8ZM_000416 [Crocinitomix sp.]|jgi:hypothetical protein
MRKLVITLVLALTMGSGTWAQDSFYEGIAKNESTRFQEYIFTSPVPEKEGYYHAENPHRIITLGVKKTKAGNYAGVTAYEEGGDSRGFIIADEISDHVSFSRSYPGIVAHKYNKDGYIFMDGMLIVLEGVSRDGLSYNRIGRIYLEMQSDEEIAADLEAKEEAKKNMSMKEKIAAAKDALQNGIAGSPSEEKLKALKLDEEIKAYLKAMNDKHLAGNKSKEAALVADIEKERADFLKLRQDQSKGLSAKMEAEKNKNAGGGSNYTIKNNSGAPVQVMTDSGSTTTISAGGSTSYICQTDIYYCNADKSKGAMIASGDDVCGTTVTID